MASELSDWMKYVPDATSLSDISIPGTHDSATYVIGAPWWKAAEIGSSIISVVARYTQCQSLSLSEQLEAGVRFLDIRIKPGAGFPLYHGAVPLGMTLIDALDQVDHFLTAHKQETVIVCIKSESDDDRSKIADDLKRFLDARKKPLYMKSRIPTLGEVRGQAVLLNRVFEKKDCGIFLYIDDKMIDKKKQKQADGSTLEFFVQDQYDPSPGFFSSQTRAKRDIVSEAYSRGGSGTYALRLNFLSASSAPYATPERYAEDLNERVDGFLREYAKRKAWITVLDYVGRFGRGKYDPVAAIVSVNNLTNGRMAGGRQELKAGEVLLPGDRIVSSNGAYEALFQPDRNFVVERTIDNQPIAATMTHGSGADQVKFQTDGNLVVSKGSKPIVSTLSHGKGATRLVMQDDGNLVIYDDADRAHWASQTMNFHQS